MMAHAAWSIMGRLLCRSGTSCLSGRLRTPIFRVTSVSRRMPLIGAREVFDCGRWLLCPSDFAGANGGEDVACCVLSGIKAVTAGRHFGQLLFAGRRPSV